MNGHAVAVNVPAAGFVVTTLSLVVFPVSDVSLKPPGPSTCRISSLLASLQVIVNVALVVVVS